MMRTRGELAIADSPKLAAQSVTCDRHLELVPYPLRQIGKPPAHYAMRSRDRARLDDLGQTQVEQCM